MAADENTMSVKNGAAAVAVGTVMLGTLALTLPFIAMPSRHKVVLPFMATPGNKVRKALEFVAANKCQRGNRTFLDLGSGDGEAVYQAVQVLGGDGKPWFSKAVGTELNPTLFLLSQFRRWTWHADQRARSSFECCDFWKRSVKDSHVILIFGVQPLMLPLGIKLADECPPGTYILSYRFRLPVSYDQSMGNGKSSLQAKVIYEDEEMRVYERI